MAAGVINIAVKNVAELKKEIEKQKEQSENVIKRTMSDFKSRAPGWVSQSVTEVYNIKKADVKSCFRGAKKAAGKIRIAGTLVDNIQLHYSGRLLTPTHFGMKPGRPPAKRLKGKRLVPGQNIKSTKTVGEVAAVLPPAPYQISYEVYKGSRKNLSGDVFLGANPRGGFIPFQRTGSDRSEIRSIKTTSVPQMITNEKVSTALSARLDEGLGKRLEHHLEQELKKR